MKFSLKSIATFSALSALAISPIFLSANPASAQPAGMDGTYVGGGISAGVLDGGSDEDGATFGGNIQGRFAIPNAPVSLRGAVLFSDDTSAIMPLISYDVPITNNANVYAGAGYSFVEQDGQATPLGNQDSVVLTTGVEAEVVRNVVLYGDAKLGLDAYQDSSNPALSFQLGAGYRF
ncbi:MAG: porin family protein [Leptolyngbyaceae cyanobacterium RM1_406_9]|nr:porin family protein [Leptolyngbyaceae cyanobacterium RM1_406_9]